MLFTSEQVSGGHPDKICDQIADAVLTDCLRHDPESRVAVECLMKENIIVLAGEITSEYVPDTDALAHEVLRKIGVPEAESYATAAFITNQSRDIALGVDEGGAGDQGMMYGYATDETPELMPLPFMLATRALLALREMNSPLLLPDAKAQVTYDYDSDRIDTFLISAQHRADAHPRQIEETVRNAMEQAAAAYCLNTDFKALVNPTGRFVLGGSFADTGVTGRKIMCDTYGGAAHHGGGAFSGKDPTKVDRSASYAARYAAKNVVAAGLADKVEIQLAYAIGVAKPVSIMVDTFGTGKLADEKIAELVEQNFDFRPAAIIRDLDLRRPIYRQTAAYGHFGRTDIDLPWEHTDKADALKAQAGL